MRHVIHSGLAGVLVSMLKEVGVPIMAVVTEARGLRAADASRPRDVVVPDFFVEGRHQVVDAVVTTLYRTTIRKSAFIVPGFVTKQAQDRKFLADRASSQPIAGIHGGPHFLVPFAMEYGGRLGTHALALLRALAIVALEKGRCPLLAYKSSRLSTPILVSLWVRRWQHRMPTWLHLAISKHVIRLLCPNNVARLGYI